MCLAAGIWLEGVNFAIGSGALAGRAAARAVGRGDTSSAGLAAYRTLLESSFVLKDHRKLRDAPHLVMSDLAQQQLPGPGLRRGGAHVPGGQPRPQAGAAPDPASEMKSNGVRLRDAVSQGLRALRTFG